MEEGTQKEKIEIHMNLLKSWVSLVCVETCEKYTTFQVWNKTEWFIWNVNTTWIGKKVAVFANFSCIHIHIISYYRQTHKSYFSLLSTLLHHHPSILSKSKALILYGHIVYLSAMQHKTSSNLSSNPTTFCVSLVGFADWENIIVIGITTV